MKHWCKTTVFREDGGGAFGFTDAGSVAPRSRLAKRHPGSVRSTRSAWERARTGCRGSGRCAGDTEVAFREVDLSPEAPPHSLSGDEDTLALLVLAARRYLRLTYRRLWLRQPRRRSWDRRIGWYAPELLSEDVLDRLVERGDVRLAGMDWKDNFGCLTITEQGRAALATSQPILPPNEYRFEIPALATPETVAGGNPRSPLAPERSDAVFLVQRDHDDGRKQEVAR